jgi:hypothetical protein
MSIESEFHALADEYADERRSEVCEDEQASADYIDTAASEALPEDEISVEYEWDYGVLIRVTDDRDYLREYKAQLR